MNCQNNKILWSLFWRRSAPPAAATAQARHYAYCLQTWDQLNTEEYSWWWWSQCLIPLQWSRTRSQWHNTLHITGISVLLHTHARYPLATHARKQWYMRRGCVSSCGLFSTLQDKNVLYKKCISTLMAEWIIKHREVINNILTNTNVGGHCQGSRLSQH